MIGWSIKENIQKLHMHVYMQCASKKWSVTIMKINKCFSVDCRKKIIMVKLFIMFRSVFVDYLERGVIFLYFIQGILFRRFPVKIQFSAQLAHVLANILRGNIQIVYFQFVAIGTLQMQILALSDLSLQIKSELKWLW